jgi:hypothetical protein
MEINFNTKVVSREGLIVDGTCDRCAHCSLILTDSQSIQRGMGPSCSKKGYNDDAVDPDEVQAFLHLSPYPELVQILHTKIGPEGSPNRLQKLMNELVRVCSLNRKHQCHRDICDAIDALGYKKLASTLRESLHTVEFKTSKNKPDFFAVRTKKSHIIWDFNNVIKQIPGTSFSRDEKAFLIPKKQDGLSNDSYIWGVITDFYRDHIVKTDSGSFPARNESPSPYR